MRQHEIAVTLRLAIADVQTELDRRITMEPGWVARSARLIDEIERDIDDIADHRVRRELRCLVELLDELGGQVEARLSSISTHDLWDPLRTLVVDLRDNL